MSSMIIKKEIRILGVDDCPFKYTQEKSKLVGSVFRGNSSIEGIIIKEIEVDGFDSTEKIITIVDRKEAIKAALDEAQEGDTVLIAGKGHETYQEIGGKRIQFDDRVIVEEYLNLEKEA